MIIYAGLGTARPWRPKPFRAREGVLSGRFAPEKAGHRACFASGTFYDCDDHECPDRSACEKAVSPWIPGP